jgi:hypothetical protein
LFDINFLWNFCTQTSSKIGMSVQGWVPDIRPDGARPGWFFTSGWHLCPIWIETDTWRVFFPARGWLGGSQFSPFKNSTQPTLNLVHFAILTMSCVNCWIYLIYLLSISKHAYIMLYSLKLLLFHVFFTCGMTNSTGTRYLPETL